MIGWKSTKEALAKLEELLTCKICESLFSDPCSLEACDHNFCRNCVEKLVGTDSRCPECGAFAWMKDLKTNRQLVNTVNMCIRIRSLVGRKDSDQCNSPDDKNNPETQIESTLEENTFEFLTPENLRKKSTSDCITNVTATDVGQQTPTIEVQEKMHKPDTSFCQPDVFAKSLKTYSKLVARKAVTVKGTAPTVNDDTGTGSFGWNSGPIGKETIINESNAAKRKQACFGKKQSKKTKVGSDARLPENDHEKENIDEKLNFENKQEQHSTGKKSEKMENIDKGYFTKLLARKFNSSLAGSSTLQEMKQSGVTPVSEEGSSKNKAQKRKCQSAEVAKTYSNGQKTKWTEIQKGTPVKRGNKRANTLVCSKATISASPFSNEKRNKRGETPLHVAAIKGNVDTVRMLLENDVNPNTKDHAGWTPLHEACNHGHLTIAELLLDHGAMTDVPGGFDHDSPLHDAVANGRVEVARLLVSRGASLSVRNKQGLVPKDYAVTEEMQSVLTSSTFSASKETLTNSALFQKLSTDPKVLLATGLNLQQKANLQKCAKALNASVVAEFSLSVTHIVTATNASGVCPRTIKYLCGILTGKWIVNYDWISKCSRRKSWVEETLFEVKGTNDVTTEAPKRARINNLKQLPGLFDGCQFYFYGEFVPPHPSKEDLSQMISFGGGKILSREPKPDVDETLCLPRSHGVSKVTAVSAPLPTVPYHANTKSKWYRCTCFVVYDPLAEKKPRICSTNAVCTVPSTWIMDCTSNFLILDLP